MFFSCLECTSSAVQALSAFKKLYPNHRRDEVQRCIDKAVVFIEKEQQSDGSWFVDCHPSAFYEYLILDA